MTSGIIERPHYAYCLYNSGILASRLGIERVAVIEFGVAGGNGLLALERLARLIEETTDLGVKFEIYGFDTGEGLPQLEGSADLPYWFRPQQYKMDVGKLNSRLGGAKLVIGNIRDTVPTFIETMNPAAIGAMLVDVDYYSSTRECLKIFSENHVDRFLPRVHLYLDDIIGSSLEMYGPCNGMLKAVEEFNLGREDCRIHLNQNLLPYWQVPFRYQIYYAHLFNHSRYDEFVGGVDKSRMEAALRLL